jgi:hypothetical protein
MKNKKTLLIVSFALAAVLVVGQAVMAAEPNNGGMMNGNGMSGMMQMMDNEGMQKMMGAMSTPEGQEMMNSCSNFMDSYGDEE